MPATAVGMELPDLDVGHVVNGVEELFIRDGRDVRRL